MNKNEVSREAGERCQITASRAARTVGGCVCLPALNDTLSRYKGPDVSETRPHRGQHPSAAWPCVCLGWRH